LGATFRVKDPSMSMAIYKLKEDRIADLVETSFEAESILERRGLQRLLREKIAIISVKHTAKGDLF
jgi:hypothetical protein